ncbi:CLUMA_CG006715, isoform A [Clunio marinus]|uniref:CLUMA_CG006715, isoform A n=1 Tax=Clunio marinus TaxID=568069 RepID=A0A1J1I3V4_9DIPT|nr:CLUMA_CG006715, isoform A [Clunio marinus]
MFLVAFTKIFAWCFVKFILVMLRLWKWLFFLTYTSKTSLGFINETFSLLILLGLCVVDTTTIYFENSTKITSKSCDPTLLSKENVNYKNPYSSLLSKATFWWVRKSTKRNKTSFLLSLPFRLILFDKCFPFLPLVSK